jgi:hypothetical protein
MDPAFDDAQAAYDLALPDYYDAEDHARVRGGPGRGRDRDRGDGQVGPRLRWH